MRAVLIAAPTALHRQAAVAAAEAGKHVFCEKPMAMNVEECDAMIAAAERGGVILQIGFMRRFDASFQAAYERVEAGEIGEVVLVKSCTHGPTYPKPWMFDLAQSNGPLAEVCSHDIDTVRWFAGAEFTEVYAIAGNYRTPEARASHPDFYDQVLLSARLENNAQGCITGAQGVQYAYDSRVEIVGTHGLISIGGLNADTTVICTREKELRRPSVISWMNLYRDAYLAEDIEFIAAIREERPARVTGRDGRAAVAIVNAGNRSIVERRPHFLFRRAGKRNLYSSPRPLAGRPSRGAGTFPSMKAARLFGKNDLRVEEMRKPEIGAGEILLRTAAASVCGTDIRMLKHGHAQATAESPLVIGHEMAGTIESVGPGAGDYRVGQRVCVAPNYNPVASKLTVAGDGHLEPSYRALGIHEDGAFAEFVRIPALAVQQGNVFPIPDSVSFTEAAMVEPMACVYNAYEKARTGPGDTVLIIGAGPIGIMHGKISRLAGAGKVIINDVNVERLEMARRIDPSFLTIHGDLRGELHRLTGGAGADVIITACPIPEVQTLALELAAVNGRIVFFGGLPKDRAVVPLDTNLIHYRQLMVTGTTRQSLRQFQAVLTLVSDRVLQLEDLVTSTFSLDDSAKAIAAMATATGLKSRLAFAA